MASLSPLLLVGEGFAPWTEKARWALDHHRIAYRYEEYTPLVSEPWLRIRARRFRGLISVPYLLGPGLSLGDSFAIALYTDRIGGGEPLAPAELAIEIHEWNQRSERIMRAGRAQIMSRTAADPALQAESLPPSVPRSLRTLFAGSARIALAYLRWKYAVRPLTDEVLEPELAAIRAALGRQPSARPLLGRFTLADIAIVAALQAVRPHPRYPTGLGPKLREGWARPALASRWEDVLAWRDAMIERHRAARLI
jgi:glutathione S-transferase